MALPARLGEISSPAPHRKGQLDINLASGAKGSPNPSAVVTAAPSGKTHRRKDATVVKGEPSTLPEEGNAKRTMIGLAICLAGGLACGETEHASQSHPASSAEHAAAPSGTVLSGSLGEGITTTTATVLSVDMETRRVTLRNEDGKEVTIIAGPEVRNLAQVKKGDVLRVTYRETMAYQVSRSGSATAGIGRSTEVQRAAPGENPWASVTGTTSVRATITNIDNAKGQVTLGGPQGGVMVVTVRDPSKLDQIRVGDLLDVTYTEALALTVEKGDAR